VIEVEVKRSVHVILHDEITAMRGDSRSLPLCREAARMARGAPVKKWKFAFP
jgi:hypothetical protein